MSVKLTGLEFKAFGKDPTIWGNLDGSVYWDELVIKVDEVETTEDYDLDAVPDQARVEVIYGYILRNGVADDLVKEIRQWMKNQTTRYFLVEVAADKAETVMEAVRKSGGKVK